MILQEMARLGYIDDLELIIWTDDPGSIPHFHLRDRTTKGDNFHCCVRIDKAEYFQHDGKNDKLNSKQKKNLCSFLNQKVLLGTAEITNWDKVIMYWNDNSSNITLDSDTEMPDYTKLI